jgi:hypothetical protein
MAFVWHGMVALFLQPLFSDCLGVMADFGYKACHFITNLLLYSNRLE